MIAIGGGSVIDMAKLIRAEVLKPLIAIPTTAGSGSEATHFAVVYVKKIKHSLTFIPPEISIVDPQFTLNLPKPIAASSGIDALSQAIESYWSVNSTEKSKQYSKEAILILKDLDRLIDNPTKHSRLAMAKAANLAGKAINITKTTAPHAISYPITSYFNIPHGHAVGLTLGDILVYNSKGNNKVKKTISEICNILGVEDAISAKEKIIRMMNTMGLETDTYKLEITTEKDIKLILDNINLERLKNNPRKITQKYLNNLFKPCPHEFYDWDDIAEDNKCVVCGKPKPI